MCTVFWFSFSFRLFLGPVFNEKVTKKRPQEKSKRKRKSKKLYTQYLTIKILVNSRKKHFRKSAPFWRNRVSKIIKNHDLSVLCHLKLGPQKIAKFWDDFFSVSKYILYHFHVSTPNFFCGYMYLNNVNSGKNKFTTADTA